MSDFFSSNSDNFDLGSASGGGSDKLKAEEIQKVIMMEQQKAQLNAQVNKSFSRIVPLISNVSKFVFLDSRD